MAVEVNDNWYESFFQGINCEIWENAILADYTKQEVGFLIGELGLRPGEHILDVPCGFGRHSIEFSQRGFNVTGIDISATFIQGLTEKIKAGKLNIKAIQADILTVELAEKFSGAVCLGNSFGYFNYNKVKLFVEKVSTSLETGAKFIINSGMIAESILPNFSHYANDNMYTVGNITMEVANTYNAEEGYMVSHLLYTKEGNKEEHYYKHYVFTLGEIKRLLESCGMDLVRTYSSTLKDKYKPGDKQIYIVAEKK